MHQAEEWVRGILPSALIHRSTGNRFEYPGIRLVWDLVQLWLSTLEPGAAAEADDPSRHVILYFHTKRMTCVDDFDTRPQIMKAGLAGSPLGFVWYNFWSAIAHAHTHQRLGRAGDAQYKLSCC